MKAACAGWFRRGGLAGAALLLAGAAFAEGPPPKRPPRDGRAVAAQLCRSCHALPAPGLLPKAAWPEVVRHMGLLLGVDAAGGACGEPAGEAQRATFDETRRALVAAGRMPEPGAVSVEELAAVCRHYVSGAPASVAPAPETIAPARQFAAGAPLVMSRSPLMHPFAAIVPGRGALVANQRDKTLLLFPARGGAPARITLPGVPVHLQPDGTSYLASLIGPTLAPKNDGKGMLARLDLATGKVTVLLEGLRRPVFPAHGDVTGDGRPDLVLPEFGRWEGALTLHEGLGTGAHRSTTLMEAAGCLQAEIADVDDDGRDDVAYMVAGANEELGVLLRTKAGGLTPRVLYRGHPAFGFTGFQHVDLDGDGRKDFLVWNGDNQDLSSQPRKPYAGIRLLRHEGGGRFRERLFLPMGGVSRVVAADFDGDGDVDLAAVRYWMNPELREPSGFLYFENTAGPRRPPVFARQGLDELEGPLVALGAGDLDGDGDLDLVVAGAGAFVLTNLHRR